MKTYQIILIGTGKVLTYTFHEKYGQTLDNVGAFFNEIIEECESTKKRGLKPYTKDVYVINDSGRIITEYHS